MLVAAQDAPLSCRELAVQRKDEHLGVEGELRSTLSLGCPGRRNRPDLIKRRRCAARSQGAYLSRNPPISNPVRDRQTCDAKSRHERRERFRVLVGPTAFRDPVLSSASVMDDIDTAATSSVPSCSDRIAVWVSCIPVSDVHLYVGRIPRRSLAVRTRQRQAVVSTSSSPRRRRNVGAKDPDIRRKALAIDGIALGFAASAAVLDTWSHGAAARGAGLEARASVVKRRVTVPSARWRRVVTGRHPPIPETPRLHPAARSSKPMRQRLAAG